MTTKEHQHPTIKFYQEDIVQSISSPNSYGIVLRCWHDAEESTPPAPAMDALMRPLERGEVGVSFFPLMNHEILSEKELILIDRCFQAGDLCKHVVEDVQSGVVTNVRVEGHLEHAISGEAIEGWVTTEQLEVPVVADVGDYVVFDDWVGQVIESFEEATVELGTTGQLIKIPEISCRLTVGEKGVDIIPSPEGPAQGILEFLVGHHPSHLDTVVAVKPTVLAVCWLAINQALSISDAQNRKRPQRFWFGDSLNKLVVVRGKLNREMRVGDKVNLKNTTTLPITTHGRTGDPANLVMVHTLTVKETHTSVDVLWQDGTRETLNSKDLIPWINPDDSDCWPGDHVIWKGEDEQRAGVIQSVNAADRTATILYSDTGVMDIASVLELDPHGITDFSAANSQYTSEGLGVRRGEFVFVHQEGTTNGLEKPSVPRIGEVEPWAQENPEEADGQYSGWRKELADIGIRIATQQSDCAIENEEIGGSRVDTDLLDWFGEVTEIHLDGTVEVTHPNLKVAIYPLERLTKLHDGMEQLQEEWWADGLSEGHGSHSHDGEEVWTMGQDGVWRPQPPHSADADEWEETDLDDNDDAMDTEIDWREEAQASPSGVHLSLFSKISPTNSDSSPEAPQTLHSAEFSTLDSSVVLPSSTDVGPEDHVFVDDNINAEDSARPQWKRFDILPSVPQDHAFYTSPSALPAKSFLARLTREYRVLENSLPDCILVRAFEDRTDLLRTLIIGPENTPYEDAPFVIDWMLDSNFPHSPPKAHFLSWTNGNGRVNPNLYEDGKICLSILGTWAGDKTETWSAARSSLLQAFVSIQGLVLVKEPWFCEPAYEKLRGTEEGIVNSRLYNEKAYVLSRGFVRRALENPVGGLQSELHWMYYTNNRLQKVVRDAYALIERSKSAPDKSVVDPDLAVSQLSGGGMITLDRTLTKLQRLLDSHKDNTD